MKTQHELIAYLSIIFRDLRIICAEKLYFTIIYLNIFFFFGKYISLILALVTLALLPLILKREWQMKFLILLKLGYQNKNRDRNFDRIPLNAENRLKS